MAYSDKHTHIEGSVPPETIVKLLQKYRNDITTIPEYFTPYHLETIHQLLEQIDNHTQEKELIRYLSNRLVLEEPAHNLGEFIKRLPTKFLKFLLRTSEDLDFVITNTLQQYGQEFENVELFFCPRALANDWLSDDAIVDRFSYNWQIISETRRMTFVLSLRRDQDDISIDYIKKVTGQYSKYANKGISKLDICGDESSLSFMEITKQLDTLKHAKQELTLHVGETTDRDLEFILKEYPTIKQINHGILAAFNPDLIKRMAQNEVELTICPLTYIFTGTLSKQQVLQALETFKTAGIKYTIGTDDSTIIKGSVYAPYEFLKSI